MRLLDKEGIPTHFVEELSERETLVKRVTIIPLEVIVRNIAAGSLAKRLGLEEGHVMSRPVIEYCYKDDSLGDPMVNDYHILAMNFATAEELSTIANYALKVNEFLKDYLLKHGIVLVDFKLEFGKLSDGTIVLADEISPDTCRWDSESNEADRTASAATSAASSLSGSRRILGEGIELHVRTALSLDSRQIN